MMNTAADAVGAGPQGSSRLGGTTAGEEQDSDEFEEDEVAAIAGYTMAMAELRKRVAAGTKTNDDDENAEVKGPKTK